MSERIHSPFYKPPTAEEIAERGPVLAEAHAQVRARKIGSRALSATLASAMGIINLASLKLFGQSSIGIEEVVVVAFGTPVTINAIAQIRTERTQKRDLKHLSEVANEIIDEYDSHMANLEQDNLTLKQTIETAGLELPSLNSGEPQ